MKTIREARRAAGLTQMEMAQRFGIGRRTIQDWEAGTHKCPDWAERMIVRGLNDMTVSRVVYSFINRDNGETDSFGGINKKFESAVAAKTWAEAKADELKSELPQLKKDYGAEHSILVAVKMPDGDYIQAVREA